MKGTFASFKILAWDLLYLRYLETAERQGLDDYDHYLSLIDVDRLKNLFKSKGSQVKNTPFIYLCPNLVVVHHGVGFEAGTLHAARKA